MTIRHLTSCVLALSCAAEARAQSQATTTNQTPPATQVPASPQASTATTAPDPSSVGVEEIVVTAQRRSERLQNVPVAVTAASAARLEAAGISNTQELSFITPGLSLPQTGGYTQPHIRGVGSNTNGPGLEPPVATYIDGVYIAAAPAALLTLNNVDRIEVLKGPQGTLFGRNATGGLIQVVTKDPKQDPSMAVNLSYANYQDVTADAYVTGGILPNLAADLAVRYENQNKGWGTNLATGNPTGNLPHDFAARSKFLWDISADTQIRLAVDYEDRISRRDAQHLGGQYPGTFDNPFFGGPFPKGGIYDIDSTVDQENTLKSGGASLQINQNVGDHLAVQSITAYRKSRYDFLLDLDGTPANLISLFGRAKDQQFSQELQVSTRDTGPLKLVGGLFFYFADDRWEPLLIRFGPSVVSPVPNVPTTIVTQDRERTDSLAGYAQATYEIFAGTNLTLGGRYTYERKRIDGTLGFQVAGATVSSASIPDPALGIPSSVNFRNFSYRVALDHKFGSDILGYVSYNTGFKSGGYNLAVPSNPPYLPEKIGAAEVGLKTEFFNHHLRINGAAYHYSYTNIQVGRYIDNNESIFNGARARVYGADVDAEVVLTRGLSLNGGFAYTNAKFTSFPGADSIVPVAGCTPPPGGVCPVDARGRRLPFAPTTTFNLGGDYKVQLGVGTFALSATYFRTSSYFSNPDNVAFQPAYDLVTASLSWTDNTDHLSIKVWAKNIGNTIYTTGLAEASYGEVKSFGAPRTYGVTLGYKF